MVVGEARVVGDAGVVVAQVGVLRALCRQVLLGQGDALRGIEAVELGRCDEREVRANERDEQRPGLLAPARRLLAQPGSGACRDIAVVARIGRFARAGELGELAVAVAARDVLADEALEVADAVDDVHRQLTAQEREVLERALGKLQARAAEMLARRDFGFGGR